MKKNIIKDFEKRFNLVLITQEAGFGKVVTGLIPKDHDMFIEFDKSIGDKPEEAYQYCDILAIQDSGIQAKCKLSKWLKSIDDKNLYLDVDNQKYILKRKVV